MTAPASLAVESMRRGAHAGLAGLAPDREAQTFALAALHRTLSVEAASLDCALAARIDALTRALAVEINATCAHPGNADAARALMRNAWLLAGMHLNTLLTLPRAPTQPATGEKGQ